MKILPAIAPEKLFGYLLFGVPLCVMAFCLFRIKPLKDAQQQRKYLQAQVERLEKAPATLAVLRKQIGQYPDVEMASGISQEELIREVGEFCQRHSLQVEIPPHSSKEVEVGLITSFEIKLKGAYHDMLQLASFLEQQPAYGRIASIELKKKKDRRSRKDFLGGTLYLQYVTDEKDS